MQQAGEEDKKAEDGEVTQENGERNEDAEKEKVDGEEEKENDNETVKNGAKENGGKTEADPNKMKSGECKSVFLTVQKTKPLPAKPCCGPGPFVTGSGPILIWMCRYRYSSYDTKDSCPLIVFISK